MSSDLNLAHVVTVAEASKRQQSPSSSAARCRGEGAETRISRGSLARGVPLNIPKYTPQCYLAVLILRDVLLIVHLRI